MSASKRIFIIGLSNVGDAILTAPVVARLHAAYLEALITLVVGERARTVFANDPRIARLLTMENFDGVIGKLRLLLTMWGARPDVLIDLRGTALPLFWRPWLIGRYLRRVPSSVTHMRDRHLWRLEAQHPPLRRVDAAAEYAVWLNDEDVAGVERLVRRWALQPERPLVVICPSARSHIKRWGAERFARVADRLIEQLNAQVVLTGEPSEMPIVHEVMKAMKGSAYSAAGCTTVTQLGELMRRARLVITNDSATLHLACAVGCPVLAIFGPTDAVKYGPTGPRDRVIRRQLFCSPCEQALCRFNHECMRFVSDDEVFAAATAMLAESPATQSSATQP